MKQLRPDGSWEVVLLDPSQHTVENLLHDLYQSRGWADASAEDYLNQSSAEAPTEMPEEPTTE